MEKSKTERVADLMEVNAATGGLWSQGEFEAILRHHLRAPLRLSMGQVMGSDAAEQRERDHAWTEMTCAELFADSRPPMGALQGVKQFAKACRDDPAGPLPPEVATVIYYSSIAAALLRSGVMITAMPRTELIQGFDWVIRRAWVDAATRSLIVEAKKRLEMSGTSRREGGI